MVENTNLYMFLIGTLQPECQARENSRRLSEEFQNKELDDLLGKLDDQMGRLGDPNYPREVLSFLQCTTILKAEEHSDLLTHHKTKKIVDYFISLCQSRSLNIPDYISHINSIMVKEILGTEDLDSVFQLGKISFLLKQYSPEISIIDSSLEIAYSPFIFEMALGTDKDKIIEALKALIKAKDLNLDSTGADHAIIENALSWVEDNEDYYRLKENQNIPVNPDRQSTQIINGLLSQIETNDQDFNDRLRSLKERYGAIEVFNNYRENYYEEANLDQIADNSGPADEISSINQITISSDPFKTTSTDNKKIFTHIYKGFINANHLEICIKKIRAADKNDLRKFQHEVNIMRTLSGKHETFLKFYGSFIINNELYIIMEFVEDNLMDVMKKTNLTELQQIDIAKKLLEGFAFLSQLKIYHRDIKPHNILMTPKYDPKIIDFGITVFDLNPNLSSDTSLATNSKFVQGTLGYMSPEQKIAFEQYKANKPVIKYGLLLSDVYSLGITFFQMATGRDVSKYEESSNNEELLRDVGRLQSKQLRDIIAKMVHREPTKRLTFIEILGSMKGKTFTIIN